MTVQQQADGSFAVMSSTGEVVRTFATNADAWRWADRCEEEAIADQDQHERISHAIREW